MTDNLESIFSPKSIAIIGASRERGSIGREILENLMKFGYKGRLHPVNPCADHIGYLKAYPSVLNVPDDVDMAVVVVPAGCALEVIEECGEKGVKGLVVITAGFNEIGGEGEEREKKLKELVKKYGMRMVGPNCMGVINTDLRSEWTRPSLLPCLSRAT